MQLWSPTSDKNNVSDVGNPDRWRVSQELVLFSPIAGARGL
jgi:hypothetical protein